MFRSTTLPTIIAVILAGILFLSVNALARRYLRDARLDLTQERLFTVSPVTDAALAKIPEPITLKFYYSDRLGQLVPSYGVYAERVRELLEAYASRAHGKILLQILDPVPFSETEDEAEAAGLQGVPAEDGGEPVYFGLTGTNSTDDRATIGFFQTDRERFLEYDLTKLVQSLAFPQKKVIGLISSLDLDGDPMAALRGRPAAGLAVMDQLRESFEIQKLPPTIDRIPDGVDVLMIVQPHDLPPAAEYAIDQYVLGGGHALVFADPLSELSRSHPAGAGPTGDAVTAKFDRLLKAWGIELQPGSVVGDRTAARRVNAGDAEHPEPADYVAWVQLDGDDINADDPVTGKLSQVALATAGALSPLKDAKTKFEPLLRSSDVAELIDASRLGDQPDVLSLLREFKASGERYTMAARVTGITDTAFPDGPPKPEAPDPSKPVDPKPPAPLPTQLTQAAQPINVIVVADTDVLDDRFWISQQSFFGRQAVVPIANNGDFVQNAIENLAGTGELIGLRSRGSSVRPFLLVDAMQRTAEDTYRAREKTLEERLHDAQAKLSDAKAQNEGGGGTITTDEQKTIDQFRTTVIQTRSELRQVQLALRQNIDRLKLELVALNCGLVPVAVAIAALVLGVVRHMRRRRRMLAA